MWEHKWHPQKQTKHKNFQAKTAPESDPFPFLFLFQNPKEAIWFIFLTSEQFDNWSEAPWKLETESILFVLPCRQKGIELRQIKPRLPSSVCWENRGWATRDSRCLWNPPFLPNISCNKVQPRYFSKCFKMGLLKRCQKEWGEAWGLTSGFSNWKPRGIWWSGGVCILIGVDSREERRGLEIVNGENSSRRLTLQAQRCRATAGDQSVVKYLQMGWIWERLCAARYVWEDRKKGKM